jgi:hypothetical protein
MTTTHVHGSVSTAGTRALDAARRLTAAGHGEFSCTCLMRQALAAELAPTLEGQGLTRLPAETIDLDKRVQAVRFVALNKAGTARLVVIEPGGGSSWWDRIFGRRTIEAASTGRQPRSVGSKDA